MVHLKNFFYKKKKITETISLTNDLSIEHLALFNGPTAEPIHAMKANLARLLNSSPVKTRMKANNLSSSIMELKNMRFFINFKFMTCSITINTNRQY